MFEPGTRVVCVDGRFPEMIRDYYNALPVMGQIYVVRDVVPGIDWEENETVSVLLEELHNKPNAHEIEPGFAPWRFCEVAVLLGELKQEAAKVRMN